MGVTEVDRIQRSSIREEVWKECFRRVKSILRSVLNARNRIDGINSLALPATNFGQLKFPFHKLNMHQKSTRIYEKIHRFEYF